MKAHVFSILNWTSFFVYKTQPTFINTFWKKIITSRHLNFKYNFYRWTSLFYGDHASLNESRGSQESLDAQVHKQDKVWNIFLCTVENKTVNAGKVKRNQQVLPIWFPFQLVNKHKALTSIPIKFTYRENQWIYFVLICSVSVVKVNHTDTISLTDDRLQSKNRLI